MRKIRNRRFGSAGRGQPSDSQHSLARLPSCTCCHPRTHLRPLHPFCAHLHNPFTRSLLRTCLPPPVSRIAPFRVRLPGDERAVGADSAVSRRVPCRVGSCAASGSPFRVRLPAPHAFARAHAVRIRTRPSPCAPCFIRASLLFYPPARAYASVVRILQNCQGK